MVDERISRLIGTIYDAASDSRCWQGFFQSYSELVQVDFIGIQVHEFRKRESRFLFSQGEGSAFSAAYHSHYTRVNLWRDRGRPHFRQGEVVPSEQHTPNELVLRSEFYNDFLRPARLRHSVAGVITSNEDSSVVLSINRRESREAFGAVDYEITASLLPHLMRACALQERIELLSAGEAVLNRLSLGVMFLSQTGRFLFANRAAEEVLRGRDALEVRDSLLRAYDSKGDTALRRAIQDALSPDPSTEARCAILLSRRSLQPAYQVIVDPIRRQFKQFAGGSSPAIVVLIKDPAGTEAAPADILTALYGLTKREAVVAQAVARGMTPGHIAEALSMSYETVRTHLRRIFHKTGVTRQAELMRLLGGLPGLR